MTGQELNREFWQIILLSWSMDEIDSLSEDADNVEACTKWQVKHDAD